MVDSVGKGSLSQEALLAALRAQSKKSAEIQDLSRQISGSSPEVSETPSQDFAKRLAEGVEAVDSQVTAAGELPEKLVRGDIEDFHEVAVQLRQADLSFRFAMEIRNKLIDAYREVMRMNV